MPRKKKEAEGKSHAEWYGLVRAAEDALFKLFEETKPGEFLTKEQSRRLDWLKKKLAGLCEVEVSDSWLGDFAAPLGSVGVENCHGLSRIGYTEEGGLELQVFYADSDRVGLAIRCEVNSSPFHCMTVAVIGAGEAEALAGILRAGAKAARHQEKRAMEHRRAQLREEARKMPPASPEQ